STMSLGGIQPPGNGNVPPIKPSTGVPSTPVATVPTTPVGAGPTPPVAPLPTTPINPGSPAVPQVPDNFEPGMPQARTDWPVVQAPPGQPLTAQGESIPSGPVF